MKKIALIIGKMHSGGKKTLIMNYLKNIHDNDLHFDLIVDKDSNAIPYTELKSLNCNIFLVPSYIKVMQWTKKLSQIFRRNHYDIVHSYLGLLSFIPLGVAKKEKIHVRIAESISAGNFREKKNIIKIFLKPFASTNATHYLACGRQCGIYQFGKRKYKSGLISIFSTAIDTDAWKFNVNIRNEARKRFGIENDTYILGFIGRLVPQKNPFFILSVFFELKKMHPNTKLWIIGDGCLRDKMERKTCKIGIQHDVTFFGRNEDIHQFYNAMDGFILPSLYEGFSVVALEAQCNGLPSFLSTNNPEETKCTNICERISLKERPSKWAQIILSKAIVKHRSAYFDVVSKMGFDIHKKAEELESFYLNI